MKDFLSFVSNGQLKASDSIIKKSCSVCMRRYQMIPLNAQPWIDESLIGFIWQCSCNNTIMVKLVVYKDSNKRGIV